MNQEQERPATAAPSSPTEVVNGGSSPSEPTKAVVAEQSMDLNVRVAKDSSTRKLITFVMNRLEQGGTVTLQALNVCVHKAITIALIVRDRLGNIHQVNSLLVVQETKEGEKSGADETQQTRTSSGIQIILSKSPLNKSEVGYEKPKPKGFASMNRQRSKFIKSRLTFFSFEDRQQRQRPRATPAGEEQKSTAPKAPVEKPSAQKPVEKPTEKKSKTRKPNREKTDAEPAPTAKESNQRRRSRRPER